MQKEAFHHTRFYILEESFSLWLKDIPCKELIKNSLSFQHWNDCNSVNMS